MSSAPCQHWPGGKTPRPRKRRLCEPDPFSATGWKTTRKSWPGRNTKESVQPGTDRRGPSLRAAVSPWLAGESRGDTPGRRGALSITRGTDCAPRARLQPTVTLARPPAPPRRPRLLPTLARAGRQPLRFLLSLPLATRTARPAGTRISGSEGRSPQGSAGAGPAQPSAPGVGAARLPRATHDSHTSRLL